MEEVKSIYNYFSSNIVFAKSKDVFSDDIRLNAGYYEIRNSIQIGKDVEFFPLSTIASVLFPGIFKRYLVDNKEYGIKFLTTSDMMMLEPDTEKYLSLQLTPNIQIYKVSENTLLVSRSGSIGNTIYVDDRIKNYALTEDALRVSPYKIEDMGLLYFYFTSEYGNDLITGKQSGAVIDHIYEADLLKLKIPKLGNEICKKLYLAYLKIKKCREDAHKLVEDARLLVIKYNYLTSLSDVEYESLDPQNMIQIRRTHLSEFTDDYRLDSHYYSSHFQKLKSNIISLSPSYTPLIDLCESVYMCNRFIRNFVGKENGVQLIGTKNLMEIRPIENKFLAKDGLPDDVIIEKNWILLARVGSLGGTFGKVGFVWRNYEGCAGSDNIIRIVPNIEKIDAGYLYAYLSSEYGYNSIIQIRHGALQDALDPGDISKILIPLPSEKQQKEIGDIMREAYDLRSEAIRLEDEAQVLLTQALTKE